MISVLLLISLAPVLIIALYIYIRDKYEKEPFKNLLKALFIGVLIILPVVFIENILISFSEHFEAFSKAAYHAFIVASMCEEGFKYLGFILIFWGNKNLNEKFDGIVYSVFISLGFAAIENILYVFKGGIYVGIVRALTAVPAHALFGTVMGFYFGLARFYPDTRTRNLILAFVMPFIWHGLYDFLLLGQNQILLLLFIPFIIFFWINGFRKMKKLSDDSEFRNVKIIQPQINDRGESK
ncbi:MAG: PrsW family intramembrane metalloprotease [Odoribacter sp.]|nr:PrsW family intramembrane metalloprotease [Odoribacter sp.]